MPIKWWVSNTRRHLSAQMLLERGKKDVHSIIPFLWTVRLFCFCLCDIQVEKICICRCVDHHKKFHLIFSFTVFGHMSFYLKNHYASSNKWYTLLLYLHAQRLLIGSNNKHIYVLLCVFVMAIPWGEKTIFGGWNCMLLVLFFEYDTYFTHNGFHMQ